MLRFSKEADYGLTLLRHLFRQGAGGVHSARDLAEATTLPLPMVAGLLKRLAKHGILVSYRGARGGYALARGEISVVEALEALQGPLFVIPCDESIGDGCLLARGCPIASCMREISTAVRGALEALDLSSLLASPSSSPMHLPHSPLRTTPDHETEARTSDR